MLWVGITSTAMAIALVPVMPAICALSVVERKNKPVTTLRIRKITGTKVGIEIVLNALKCKKVIFKTACYKRSINKHFQGIILETQLIRILCSKLIV